MMRLSSHFSNHSQLANVTTVHTDLPKAWWGEVHFKNQKETTSIANK